MNDIQTISLAEETQRRYLNYALSVITSRALPDVRDGLKPVQRRILYAMYHDLHLTPDAQVPRSAPRSSATCMGKLPPARRHRDLRRAGAHGAGLLAALPAGRRPRQLRLARRRLAPAADALHRVPSCATLAVGAARRARQEDRRLPAQLRRHAAASRSCCRRASRNLLSTARTGIAVGMATNIPPHNLGEVVDALHRAHRRPEARVEGPAQARQGPGLPDRRPDPRLEAGAARRSTRRARARSSCAASGSSRSRKRGGSRSSSPRSPTRVNKCDLVEKIGELIIASASCRSCSTCATSRPTDVRIVLEMKTDADPSW